MGRAASSSAVRGAAGGFSNRAFSGDRELSEYISEADETSLASDAEEVGILELSSYQKINPE